MLKHVLNWQFTAGSIGLIERDILPTKYQTRFGPEQPSFKPVLAVIEEVCGILEQCDQIHLLYLTLLSDEPNPGSMELLLKPIMRLRNIQQTEVKVLSMDDSNYVEWQLKPSYGFHMAKVMALPEGAKTPEYVPVEIEEKDENEGIFEMVYAHVNHDCINEGPSVSHYYADSLTDSYLSPDDWAPRTGQGFMADITRLYGAEMLPQMIRLSRDADARAWGHSYGDDLDFGEELDQLSSESSSESSSGSSSGSDPEWETEEDDDDDNDDSPDDSSSDEDIQWHLPMALRS
jgi:hypothetical protein